MNAKGRAIQRLKRQVKKLTSKLSAAEEMADRLNCEISQLTEEDVSSTTHRENRIADSLKATPQPDGGCKVSIDGSAPLRLSPGLWRLLSLLSDEKAGDSTDDCIGWKQVVEVRMKLSKEFGRKVTKHGLENLIWRLRDALGPDNRDLVQTRKGEGLIRLALRRKAPPQVVISP
jgi:hypothetical protein